MGKIILEDNAMPSSNNHNNNSHKNGHDIRPNIFQGRTAPEAGNAKFPDWDIVPPNQFINPRIKPQ
jgi:hypothetical protein